MAPASAATGMTIVAIARPDAREKLPEWEAVKRRLVDKVLVLRGLGDFPADRQILLPRGGSRVVRGE